jgi:hypothetical protein
MTWTDLAAELTADQIALLQEYERHGWTNLPLIAQGYATENRLRASTPMSPCRQTPPRRTSGTRRTVTRSGGSGAPGAAQPCPSRLGVTSMGTAVSAAA